MKKLSIGIFSFTCDEGCSMQILEVFNNKFKEWENLIEIKHFRLISPRKDIEKLDVAFVEGAISTKRDLEGLKKVRETSKKVIAIGSCAINGFPSNQRNFFDKKVKQKIKPFLKKFNHLENVEPIKKFISVDGEINGCPISEDDFIKVLEDCLIEFGVKDA
ncbi:MAG: hypothetical protein J7K22_00765 [Nanoarchaeota archaeon]|nr:hypothetical protein [Nanoarchaeota archaeon]